MLLFFPNDARSQEFIYLQHVFIWGPFHPHMLNDAQLLLIMLKRVMLKLYLFNSSKHTDLLSDFVKF